MAATHGTVAHLLPQTYKRMVAAWLEEDCPSLDYGGFVVGEKLGEARLLGKSPVGRIDSVDVTSPHICLDLIFSTVTLLVCYCVSVLQLLILWLILLGGFRTLIPGLRP